MSVQVSFKQDFNIGRISDKNIRQRVPGYTDVQCFPIYSYLLALNITHVDYFSLDVEGDELDVLMTLPFDKVNIEVREFLGPICSTIDPYINMLVFICPPVHPFYPFPWSSAFNTFFDYSISLTNNTIYKFKKLVVGSKFYL